MGAREKGQLWLGEREGVGRTRLDERDEGERLDAGAKGDDELGVAEQELHAPVGPDLHDVAAVAALDDATADLLGEDRRGGTPGPAREGATRA